MEPFYGDLTVSQISISFMLSNGWKEDHVTRLILSCVKVGRGVSGCGEEDSMVYIPVSNTIELELVSSAATTEL